MRISGLQVRLIAALSLFLAALAIPLCWQAQKALEAQNKQAARALVLHAALGARSLRGWVQEQEELLTSASARPWQPGDLSRARAMVKEARAALPEAMAIAMRKPDGTLMAKSGSVWRHPGIWATQAARTGIPQISDLIGSHFNRLVLAYPVIRAGHVRAVLIAVFDSRILARPFRDLPLHSEGVTVVDGAHRYLYAAGSKRCQVGGSRSPSDPRSGGAGGNPVVYVSQNCLNASAPVEGTRFHVVVSTPKDVVNAHVRKLMVQLWGMFGLLGAMVVLVGLWMNRAIVRPVVSITSAARRIEGGDLAARVGIQGEGEVAELSRAIDSMTEKIAHLVRTREIYYERSPLAQIRIDSEGRLLDCNPTAHEALSRLGAMTQDRVFVPAGHEALASAIAYVLETSQPWSGQLQVGEGDQGYYWSGLAFPVDGLLPPNCVVAIQLVDTTDTERKKYHLEQEVRARAEALSSALTELRALDRAKTEFLSLISHELRTPLNVITGYAGMLTEGALGELSTGAQGAVTQVQHAGARLMALVNDLIDVTRLEASALDLRLEPVDYAALVQDVLYERAGEAETKGVSLQAQIPDDLPAIWADAHRTGQILENLLSNALKFARAGDGVVVRARSKDCTILTEVTDTGPGIPSAALPKLFERFYQVDMSATRQHGGTGLGLAIVKGLVEAMGGQVGCSSVEGEGSTFWFELPTAPKPRLVEDRA